MLKEIEIKEENSGSGKDILYLTDDLQLLKTLRDKGAKAAAILTAENRNEDFTGIPYAVERPEELEQRELIRIYKRLAGLPWDILETERCRLREMTLQDLERLYEIYQDAAMTRYMENLYEDKAEERTYTEHYIKYIYEFYGYGIWIIEEKESGIIIGRAGIEPKEDRKELGYMIALPWQRQGYAYEVCAAILEYAWKEIGCNRIYSSVRPDNTASVRLLEKLGFHKVRGADAEGLQKYAIQRSKAAKKPDAYHKA